MEAGAARAPPPAVVGRAYACMPACMCRTARARVCVLHPAVQRPLLTSTCCCCVPDQACAARVRVCWGPSGASHVHTHTHTCTRVSPSSPCASSPCMATLLLLIKRLVLLLLLLRCLHHQQSRISLPASHQRGQCQQRRCCALASAARHCAQQHRQPVEMVSSWCVTSVKHGLRRTSRETTALHQALHNSDEPRSNITTHGEVV